MLNKKIAFYTAIFSDYKPSDTPVIFDKLKGCDYFLFTNINKELFKTSWEIINVEKEYSNILSAKNIKWKRHNILKDYDIVIWCDGYINFNVSKKDYLINYINILNKYDIIINKHPIRDCIYKECDAVISLRRDTIINVNKNKKILITEKMPRNFGLPETKIMIINNKSQELKNISAKIFDFMLENSYRDQLCVTYIFWKYKFNKYVFKNLSNIMVSKGIHNKFITSNGMPKGSWIQSAKNYRIENGFLYAELRKINGQYNKTATKIIQGKKYDNINGCFK